ncbi:MAG TPA: DinB family protein [Methylomirabilota bacterium]|nr:DinB family protein [Methylomirabilota bacterium]
MLEQVATMYRYNEWANQRILDTSEKLTPAQYRLDAGASFGSVHDTLVHIIGAEWLWLSRWKGTSPPALPSPDAFADLGAVRRRWAEIAAETRAFVAALTEPTLERVVAYLSTEGQRWAYPLWQQMLHQVNHGTQHRSEVAMALTRFDHSPGWLDFLYFVDVEPSTRPS